MNLQPRQTSSFLQGWRVSFLLKECQSKNANYSRYPEFYVCATLSPHCSRIICEHSHFWNKQVLLQDNQQPPFLTENLQMQTTAGIIINTSYAIGYVKKKKRHQWAVNKKVKFSSIYKTFINTSFLEQHYQYSAGSERQYCQLLDNILTQYIKALPVIGLPWPALCIYLFQPLQQKYCSLH